MHCQIRAIDTCVCPYMVCSFLINIIKLRFENGGDIFTRILNVPQDPPVSSLSVSLAILEKTAWQDYSKGM